jgi:KDEL-tailed cysteine endopeptidase
MLTAIDHTFMRHVVMNNLSYGTTEEFAFRQTIFAETDAFITNFNQQPGQTHTVGHNKFSTWSSAEMKRMMGYVADDENTEFRYKMFSEHSNATEVNWVEAGAVTPVKDQGQCGSCWSFSTTGALEGAHQIATGDLVSLSEEQFVQCDKPLNHGCNGGSMALAFKYSKNNAVETEDDYPYTSGSGTRGTCSYDRSRGVVSATSFSMVTPGSPDQLKAALNKGPVSIAIQADQRVFQQYTSGVLTEGCGTQLDHGVLAVGYGVLDGTEYFLVKNSWGPTWGDQGYIRLGVQDGDGVCGIQMQPVQPSV